MICSFFRIIMDFLAFKSNEVPGILLVVCIYLDKRAIVPGAAGRARF